MSKRPRRNHTPAFKAKVALAAVKGEKTLAEHLRYLGRSNKVAAPPDTSPGPVIAVFGIGEARLHVIVNGNRAIGRETRGEFSGQRRGIGIAKRGKRRHPKRSCLACAGVSVAQANRTILAIRLYLASVKA